MAHRETTFDVRVWGIERLQRASGTRYRIRWATADRRHVVTFTTAALADSKRAELLTATRRGEAFDVETGLPMSQVPDETIELSWWEWVLTYVDIKWPSLSPNSRRSMVEALIDATMAMILDSGRRPSDVELRTAMWRWAFHAPNRKAGGPPDQHAVAVTWLAGNTRRLRDICDAVRARAVLQALATRKDGAPAAATTVARKRAVLYNVLELAVEQEQVPVNPFDRIKWRAPKVNTTYDPRAVVNPDQARALLAAVADLAGPDEQDPKRLRLARQGRRLVAFFGCMYYAALRPSEALALRANDLDLPDEDDTADGGWGRLLLSGSDPEIGARWSDAGRRQRRQLKHRPTGHVRPTPCPPPLVHLLRQHLAEFGRAADGRLFAGPRGGTLTNETYTDVWAAARAKALTAREVASPLAARPYDLRHTAVSTWLAAGVDSAQVAEWAGHSVAVLHRVYAHVLADRGATARQRIEQTLGLSPADSAMASRKGKAPNREDLVVGTKTGREWKGDT